MSIIHEYRSTTSSDYIITNAMKSTSTLSYPWIPYYEEVKKEIDSKTTFKENKMEMKNFNNCREYEGNKEAIYVVCVPGASEENCKVMVNMKDHTITVEYTFSYLLKEEETTTNKKMIKVPEIYEIERTKKHIRNGILTLTVPVNEGYIFEVK